VRRSIWVPFLVLALALLAGLVISALQPMPIRAYALGAPPTTSVAGLGRGQEACEGPIRVQAAVGDVRVWGSGAAGVAWAEVSVRNATSGQAIAHGWTLLSSIPGAYDAPLDTSISPDSTFVVCVVGQGPASLALGGSAPVDSAIVMRLNGKTTPTEFSLVLLDRSRHSLLAALPTAFARAALFRFSWTGPWTFWLLVVAFLGTIATCGWAVAAAARADSQVESTPPEEQRATPMSLQPHE
jgi:hypothetical protein